MSVPRSPKRKAVILWSDDLKRLGFRPKGSRYWCCQRGYGLDSATHLSLFVCTTHVRVSADVACFDIAEFHVTFEVPGHNLHFYYHEGLPGHWTLGGHTSTAEIHRLGFDRVTLEQEANQIAAELIEAIGGVLGA